MAELVARSGEELSNQGEWVNEAIERLEQIYNQSQLRKEFTSMREVVKHLHYLAYAQGSMFWGFVREYGRNESSRNAFLAIRAGLAAQDQPYSVLRGDVRMLVEAVNANLGPTAEGGKVALGRLANYMKGVDRQVTRQRGLNIVLGMVSVVGTVVAIVALVFQVLSSTSFAPTS